MAKATLPTDPFDLLHFNMVRAHETFKLGYDQINNALADPPTKDLNNFLGYCGAWAEAISEHHDSEELIVFPFLDQKMDFSDEVESHKVIHAMLSDLLAAIKAAKADHSSFKPEEMRALMAKFREPLFSHLDEEVTHIEPDHLRKAGIDGKELAATMKKVGDHTVAVANSWTMVPFMCSHTSAEFKDVFPPLPWFLRKVVVPFVLSKRYSGYWKYAPYHVS